ncbi:glycosyltransferase family 4 protein [Staphylococcus pseudintermedius]|uniref:glycosyltransferase family 4 protein n=1 Tax=Staphylococcus pseudintermedius TaxID=283734 RepID=UPI0019DB51DE|nr:glycosyltransferase family 4 protein [Staphylococcus pseudintermedius]EGQ1687017.1 glycosyltransferase family 4 protein [Staphylococcus pseudintermedius]EGQ3537828.1 glycosyltransferase family 4 protein [Staphylococcus pseudintermedius]EGQ3768699.1 glycosyltransferase [Staphylococcus pseudintermedius]EGQ3928752.1 glycosyltransferase family 4 protein [Staphylococcus pseudintermedius]EGQ4195058.1 glycosyltransferase family 4 protein [Staphylococcus pseudintermedius]
MKSITFLMHNIFAVGGTVKTITNLANQLVHQGHQVTIISIFKSKQQPYFELDSRVTVKSLVHYQLGLRNLIPLAANRIRKFTPLLKPKYLTQYEPGFRQYSSYIEKKMIRAIQNDTSDIFVGTRASHNLLIARFAKGHQLTIGMEHMNLDAHRQELKEELLTYYPHLNAITTLTEADKQRYTQYLDAPIFVVPNMIDEKRHHIMKKNQIIAAGRFEYEKGFDLLIQAVYEIQEDLRDFGYTVSIFGDGSEKEALQQQINFLRLQDLVFLRPTTQHLSTYIAESKITCIPSRNEGFGMTILEAMNQGSIVVSFDGNTGPKSLIQHSRNGFLVPHLQASALAMQLLEIVEYGHSKYLNPIIQSGYQTVEQYQPESVYNQFKTAMDHVIATQSS